MQTAPLRPPREAMLLAQYILQMEADIFICVQLKGDKQIPM